ncbi:DUF998 domain-containing protein [Ornithinimicrobium sp. Y1694]|uniref:DUF998 domain-containing protein n=1 Tax=Ornithinimicrobium sp. Y1694 TaxID=3418590 RepID=UPI003CF9AE8D
MHPTATPPPSSVRTLRGGGSLARALVLLAAILQLSWLLESVVGSPLPTRTSYVSELMATDQEWSWLFRSADTVAGLALFIAVLLSWRTLRSLRRGSGASAPLRSRMVGMAHLGLGAFGAAMVLDAVVTPMSCAPSLDLACAQAELTGQVPLTHQLHSLTSSLSALGAVVGLVAAAVWVWST